jgi:transcription termination/antitermination protein NusA
MNNELIAVLDYLERDRGVSREQLIKLLEESLVAAARKSLGPVNELRVTVDPKTGDISAIAKLTVVETVAQRDREVDLKTVQAKFPETQLGDLVDWEVTPKDLGRIAAQTARQGFMQRLRQAEKERVKNDFANMIGEVLYGRVTRYDKGDVIISFEKAEGVLPRAHKVMNEDYQVGDHVSCVLIELNTENPGPVLVVSRTAPELVKKLFEREVTEIAEKIVEIKAVAREPGWRSKIAVTSKDPKVDPVGACVGIRGSRVKSIVRELNNERVDIVPWDPEIKRFVINSLSLQKNSRLEMRDADKSVTVFVEQDQLSQAIGQKGQNVRLASKLTGWKVEIKPIEEKVAPSMEDKIRDASRLMAAALGVAEEIASKLVSNGFLSVDGIRAADLEDIAAIEGLDPETARHIKAAAGR